MRTRLLAAVLFVLGAVGVAQAGNVGGFGAFTCTSTAQEAIAANPNREALVLFNAAPTTPAPVHLGTTQTATTLTTTTGASLHASAYFPTLRNYTGPVSCITDTGVGTVPLRYWETLK